MTEPALLSPEEFNLLAHKHGLTFEEDNRLYLIFNGLLQKSTQEVLASAMVNAEWNQSTTVKMENLNVAKKNKML